MQLIFIKNDNFNGFITDMLTLEIHYMSKLNFAEPESFTYATELSLRCFVLWISALLLFAMSETSVSLNWNIKCWRNFRSLVKTQTDFLASASVQKRVIDHIIGRCSTKEDKNSYFQMTKSTSKFVKPNYCSIRRIDCRCSDAFITIDQIFIN